MQEFRKEVLQELGQLLPLTRMPGADGRCTATVPAHLLHAGYHRIEFTANRPTALRGLLFRIDPADIA